METRILGIIIMICCLHYSRAQLSFVPVEDFYEVELGTDLNISCLYDGGVNSRVDWLEDSEVINSHQLSLINFSLGHHDIICRYTPDTGSIQTKQLTVNVYKSTQLEFLPSLTDYSYSTQLANSTPYYVYCLGYGNPSPEMEWREDSNPIASIPGSGLTLPEQSSDSVAAIDLKQFSSGLHQLSCYGYNGYTADEVFLTLSVDSSNPLLVYPDHNSTHNNSLEYLLTDSYTDFLINCSLKLFSLSPDDKWVGLTPVWTLFNDSDRLSNLSSALLSKETLGDIYCVLLARDNSTVVQKVHVAFVNTQTASLATSSTYTTSSHSTTLALTTNYTINTTTGVTFRSTPKISTSAIPITTTSPNSVQLSSLVLAVIIAVLFTLLCISLLILLCLSLMLMYRFVSKRSRVRSKTRRCSRVLYLDVMDDSYPLPLQRRDSNQYSGNALPDNDSTSGGVTRGLGVRVPIYERIPDLIIPSESADITVDDVTPPSLPQTRDVHV